MNLKSFQFFKRYNLFFALFQFDRLVFFLFKIVLKVKMLLLTTSVKLSLKLYNNLKPTIFHTEQRTLLKLHIK